MTTCMYPEIKTVTVFLVYEIIPYYNTDSGSAEHENRIVCATREMAEMWIRLTMNERFESYCYDCYDIVEMEMIA